MKNYIDYMWTPKSVYKLFTMRRLIADVYRLKSPQVFPIQGMVSNMEVVREGRDGELWVRFNTLEDYVNTFRNLSRHKNVVMCREEDYDKFVKQYSKIIQLPIESDETKLYAEPKGGCVYTARMGHVLQIDIHYINGFYTTTIMNVSDKTYKEKQDVMALRDEWLESLTDSKFEYMKEQTANIDAIVNHVQDISNPYEVQYNLFKKFVDLNASKGFGMCMYKVKYLGTDEISYAWAKTPEHLFNRLFEEYKDKVVGLETIGFCPAEMKPNVLYRVIFTDNKETTFVYRGMKKMGELLTPFAMRGEHFRVEEY